MATTSDIKNGKCLKHNNDIWQVVEFQHVKPGKGPAFVRTKLKSLNTGKVVDNTIPAGHKINFVRVERREYQFLYKDDMGYNCMNNETYEQIAIPEFKINAPEFLNEGDKVELLVNADEEDILACEVPQFVILEVTYTEPGIKGDTSGGATKPATVSTGAIVQVPLFVNQGEKIRIDTNNKSYMERVKS